MNKANAISQLESTMKGYKKLLNALTMLNDNKQIFESYDNKVINKRLQNKLRQLNFEDGIYIIVNRINIEVCYRNNRSSCSFSMGINSELDDYGRAKKDRLNAKNTIFSLKNITSHIVKKIDTLKKSIKDYDKMMKDYDKLMEQVKDFKDKYDYELKDTLDYKHFYLV